MQLKASRNGPMFKPYRFDKFDNLSDNVLLVICMNNVHAPNDAAGTVLSQKVLFFRRHFERCGA